MRTLVLLVLVLSLAACGGKKKSAANPSNTDVKAGSADQDREEQDMAKPTDPDDAMKSSDPCEGGE